MKPSTWTVRTGEDAARLFAFLGNAEPPYSVTFKAGEESRRDRQNRFSFEVYAQVAGMLGDRTAQDVRAESKLHVGIPIMRADEGFRAKYDAIVKPLPYEAKLALMVEPFDFAVTRLMNVAQMSDYITTLLAYWDANGASVMLPGYDL